ncbi:hypothetical protein HPB50_026488 [Hyalomma asiaticum]|uniref:Uncharacterized protein n=1 Tax=Hyalomma asiaticum TaxID=266040 RepID=A0ACB7STZ8_HYAAI|nr:hypothetical protein HPB50_026488 [Hyalomma asiaticum]
MGAIVPEDDNMTEAHLFYRASGRKKRKSAREIGAPSLLSLSWRAANDGRTNVKIERSSLGRDKRFGMAKIARAAANADHAHAEPASGHKARAVDVNDIYDSRPRRRSTGGRYGAGAGASLRDGHTRRILATTAAWAREPLVCACRRPSPTSEDALHVWSCATNNCVITWRSKHARL